MRSAGFEPTISAGERPQTYTLDRAATGTGPSGYYNLQFFFLSFIFFFCFSHILSLTPFTFLSWCLYFLPTFLTLKSPN